MVARLVNPVTFIGGKVTMALPSDDENTEKEEAATPVTEGAVSDDMAGPSATGRRARA